MSLDFTFNSISALTYNFHTTRIINPPLATQKETIIDIPKTLGLTQLEKKFTKRDITIEGYLEGTSVSDLITVIEAFPAFLYSEEDAQLIFNNQTDRYFLAQHIKPTVLLRQQTRSLMRLFFTCLTDPLGIAVTADDDNETGITSLDHTWEITNNGQYPVYPVITITFNQAQTHIYLKNNSLTDNRFDIEKSFANTNTLELDSRAMTIKFNGSDSPAGFGDGGDGEADFILLNTGVNELQIGSDDATIDVDVNVNFRKFYL